MPLTPAEKRKNRLKTHKQYNTYIPLFIANPFDEKLEKNKIKFSTENPKDFIATEFSVL